MQPLVSILIPAYNAQDWIVDTIQSAIAQSWPRTEVIVVNDGSTDRTLAVAQPFMSRGVTSYRSGIRAQRPRETWPCP